MGLGQVQQTGISGMIAAKAAVATAGHNIANAGTEGYSRQRVETAANEARPVGGAKGLMGTGTLISRITRINDDYLEKQIRAASRDLSNAEEKDVAFRQIEDVFNEMNGDGLNRLITRFFNEFRKLANEPESEAIRQSVREASQAVVNDFHRLRSEVEEVRSHLDARIEGYCTEVNSVTEDIKDLNIRIRAQEISGASPNDLLDQRDKLLKKLGSYMDIATHYDQNGVLSVDARGIGPLVGGAQAETFSVRRSPADDQGKPEGAFELVTTASATAAVTHQLKGGKFGALLEVRDQAVSTILDRLDTMAFDLAQAVNDVHTAGVTQGGQAGVAFFSPMDERERAAEYLELSSEVKSDISNIATAAEPDAPGDNRIALAIAGLQEQKLAGGGKASFDDWYNSIVSDVGVASARNRSTLNQQKDIAGQLGKMRDQIAGVSIDEETANLMQFQHCYDASAKVIQVADEMLRTVLDLKR